MHYLEAAEFFVKHSVMAFDSDDTRAQRFGPEGPLERIDAMLRETAIKRFPEATQFTFSTNRSGRYNWRVIHPTSGGHIHYNHDRTCLNRCDGIDRKADQKHLLHWNDMCGCGNDRNDCNYCAREGWLGPEEGWDFHPGAGSSLESMAESNGTEPDSDDIDAVDKQCRPPSQYSTDASIFHKFINQMVFDKDTEA